MCYTGKCQHEGNQGSPCVGIVPDDCYLEPPMEAFGIKIKVDKSIPEDKAMLVGTPSDDGKIPTVIFDGVEMSSDDITLWNADPNCKHNIVSLWSGIKCTKCNGWCCL